MAVFLCRFFFCGISTMGLDRPQIYLRKKRLITIYCQRFCRYAHLISLKDPGPTIAQFWLEAKRSGGHRQQFNCTFALEWKVGLVACHQGLLLLQMPQWLLLMLLLLLVSGFHYNCLAQATFDFLIVAKCGTLSWVWSLTMLLLLLLLLLPLFFQHYRWSFCLQWVFVVAEHTKWMFGDIHTAVKELSSDHGGISPKQNPKNLMLVSKFNCFQFNLFLFLFLYIFLSLKGNTYPGEVLTTHPWNSDTCINFPQTHT